MASATCNAIRFHDHADFTPTIAITRGKHYTNSRVNEQKRKREESDLSLLFRTEDKQSALMWKRESREDVIVCHSQYRVRHEQHLQLSNQKHGERGETSTSVWFISLLCLVPYW